MHFYFTAEDETKIFYKDQGTGSPVILIHGWPLNADMFEYQAFELLRSGYRVISYDRRGFGRSAQPADGYNYDTLASDLNALINHLELQKVSLVGFSMGGGEIARYLSRFGTERVANVALISSVVPHVMKSDANPNGVPEEKLEEIKDGLIADRPHFLAGFTKDFFGVSVINHPVSAETMDWSEMMANMASLKATVDCVDAFGRTDFTSDLAAFTVPTLIIHGTADKTVPIAATSDVAADKIAGALYKRYEGAPHGLFITHKADLNQDLLDFFSGQLVIDRADDTLSPVPTPAEDLTINRL